MGQLIPTGMHDSRGDPVQALVPDGFTRPGVQHEHLTADMLREMKRKLDANQVVTWTPEEARHQKRAGHPWPLTATEIQQQQAQASQQLQREIAEHQRQFGGFEAVGDPPTRKAPDLVKISVAWALIHGKANVPDVDADTQWEVDGEMRGCKFKRIWHKPGGVNHAEAHGGPISAWLRGQPQAPARVGEGIPQR